MSETEDRIEKVVDLKAPVPRVWRALTDHRAFGEWFRVKLDGPFEAGVISTGHMTYPGYEHCPWRATVETIEPERLFAFRWHDYDEQSPLDISEQPTTRVEFRLEPTADGTRLTITESGFSALPEPRRLEAMRSNTNGWNVQAEQLTEYVAASG